MDSHGPDDELRLLREEVLTLETAVDALDGSSDVAGNLARVVQTISLGSYPVAGAVGTTFAVQVQDLSGGDTEGATGTLTAETGHFFAANLASGLPPVGTPLVVEEVGNGAWVFRYS